MGLQQRRSRSRQGIWLQAIRLTPHAARRSRTQSGAHPIHGAMADRITNILCTVIVAAAFAMIGIESSAHHKPTHSGTQEYVRH